MAKYRITIEDPGNVRDGGTVFAERDVFTFETDDHCAAPTIAHGILWEHDWTRDFTTSHVEQWDENASVWVPYFHSPTSDGSAMDDIARLMSATEWDADTLDFIADIVRSTGRAILDTPEDS